MTPSLRGPVWTKITPQTGSSFHEKSHLAPVLISHGAPILGSILRTNVGGVAGEASAQVIEALARTFRSEPTPEAVKTAIDADPAATAKLQSIERERSAEWVASLNL